MGKAAFGVKTKVRGGDRAKAFVHKAKAAQRRGAKGVEAGFYATATYPDGTPVTSVAAWNTFGTKHIPQRPFMQRASHNMRKPLVAMVKAHIDPETLAVTERVATYAGLIMQAAIQKEIVDLTTPENSERTKAIKRRKSGGKGIVNPLVDTGLMKLSVTFKVR